MAEKDPKQGEKPPLRAIKGARRQWDKLPGFDKTMIIALGSLAFVSGLVSISNNKSGEVDKKKTPIVKNKQDNASKPDIRSKLKISQDRSWRQIEKSIPQIKVGFTAEPDMNDGMSGIDADFFCLYDKDKPSPNGLTTKNDVYDGASYVAKDRPALWSPLEDKSSSTFHTHMNFERMDNTNFTVKDGEVTVKSYKGVLGMVFSEEQKSKKQTFSLEEGEAHSSTSGLAGFTIARYDEPYDEYYALSLWCNEPQTDIAMAGARELYADNQNTN